MLDLNGMISVNANQFQPYGSYLEVYYTKLWNKTTLQTKFFLLTTSSRRIPTITD